MATARAHGANFFDWLGLGTNKPAGQPASAASAALSQDQVVGGLKDALAKGVRQAVASLGKEDGFLKDLHVKIQMPENLQKVEKTLRTLRQDKLADEEKRIRENPVARTTDLMQKVFGAVGK